MARKRGGGRRTNFSKYLKGNIDLDLSIGALGAKSTAVASTQDVVDTTRVSSVRATYSLSNYTKGFDIGPIAVGVAHGDYTLAEIEEFLETTGSWAIGNKIQQERANRRIRRIGVFLSPDTAGSASRLNDGKPITTKLNWTLAEGQDLKFWVYNLGTVSVGATTNANLNVFGHANLWAQ